MAEGLSPAAWSDFYHKVLRPPDDADLRLPAAESDEYKPGCNDAPADDAPGERTIVSSFWSYASVNELKAFVDPRNWGELGSAYWQEMTMLEGPEETSDGYTGVFREVVALPTGPVTVHLAVGYHEDDYGATTTFRETGNITDDVVLDRGYVMVTSRARSPAKPQTFVYATKTIVFREPALNEITDLACDNGWVDLMITMALPPDRRPRARRRRPRRRAAGAKTPDVSPADDETDLDRWAGSVHDLVDRCVETARIGVEGLRTGRFDDSLPDSLLSISDRMVVAVKQGARAWREIIGDLEARDRAP